MRTVEVVVEPGGERGGSEWHLAYDLAQDETHIAAIQEASLTKPGFGFPLEPAFFGSPEWWHLIERGRFPAANVEGRISRVFWASMGDWPEFTLRSADGSESDWTRDGDLRRYVEGLRARVSYTELEAKPDAPFTPSEGVRKVVLQIWIEQSDRRSPGIAPGPGGTGYDLDGGPRHRSPLRPPGRPGARATGRGAGFPRVQECRGTVVHGRNLGDRHTSHQGRVAR